ncbi:MAG TPA: hypothetical protein VGX93_01490, partial [Chthoniobacterales bacterium]|nr:hypothetical protein [Chthoniobacterales bacterium]
MRNKELDFNAMSKATEISGRAAANEVRRGLLDGNGCQSLKCIAGYGAFGLAIALLPLRQALADSDDQHRQILPVQSSIIPANGDQNPYGVAFVPFVPGGPLHPGDILVSNFNNAGSAPTGNFQGTGRTIVKVAPNGETSLFFEFQGNSPIGLTTALGVLKRGFVLVGSVPTIDGTFGTLQPGSLLVVDRNGVLKATLTNLLDSPWDLTIQDGGSWARVFVSNVRSGTITRLDLDVDPGGISVRTATEIASGYTSHSDPAALIVGPTGLAYDAENDTLYVASTADNEIFAVPHAATANQSKGTGTVAYQDNAHLRGPLALAFAPNG